MGSDHVTFATLLTELAREHADRPAIVNPAGVLSFAELDARATQVANALLDAGIGLGDRVAVCLRNRPEYLTLLFALARAGAVMVPVNRRSGPSEAKAIASDAEVRLLVTEPDYPEIATAMQAAGSLEKTFVVAGELPAVPDARRFEEFALSGSHVPPAVPVRGDDVQAIHYTSGTSGVAKGVLRSHRANLATARAALEAIPTRAGEAWFHNLPLYSVGVYAFALAPLLVGGNVVITERFDPEEVLTLAARRGVVMLHAVPTMWEMMARTDLAADIKLDSLRVALWGGSPLPRATAERLEGWLDTPCLGCYGATEVPCCTYSTAGIYRSGRWDSSGRPFGGTQIRVIDEEGGALPPGMWGEVLLRGPLLMDGYLNRPEATADAIDAEGWYHTGDWGRLDDDGVLTVTDRKKDMIITGGDNVYPAEVENLISTMKGVDEVAVVGLPDDMWGQTVWAFVVCSGSEVTEDDVQSFCREQLASYKVPRGVTFLGSLPRNALGKVEKGTLATATSRN